MYKELKEDIKEIKSLSKEVIKYLESKEKWLEVTVRNISDLFNRFDSIGGVDNLSEDEMLLEIKNALFERSLIEANEFTERTLDEVKEYLWNLNDESSDYDFYENTVEKLETILSKFSQNQSEYHSIEHAIEHMEDVILMLDNM